MGKRRNRAEQPPEQEVKRSAFSAAFDLPQGVLEGFSQIALSGNREAVIEGCGGILEYDPALIKMSLGRQMVQFTGRGLKIKCMTGESVIVEGFILTVEFLC